MALQLLSFSPIYSRWPSWGFLFLCSLYVLLYNGQITAFPMNPAFKTTATQQVTRVAFATRTTPLLNYGFTPKIRCAVVPKPYFADNNSNNNDANQSQLDESVTSNMSESTSLNGTTLFQRVDEAAQQLKPAAVAASSKAAMYASRRQVGRQYRALLQSCLYYSLFLCYRAYRGFFVILPAVFSETFRRLRLAVDDRPFDADDDTSVEPPEKLKWRTRITISILSSVVILAYVVGGAMRVFTTLARSLMGGTSLSQSLQNAIQMYEQNEKSLLEKNANSNLSSTGDVNGSESMDQNTKYGLAP